MAASASTTNAYQSFLKAISQNYKIQSMLLRQFWDKNLDPQKIKNWDVFLDDLIQYTDENNIQNHLFLFSASALSETAIHQLYNHCDKNTYLDIGTCLNHFMNITIDRNYLRGFWLNSGETDIRLINQW